MRLRLLKTVPLALMLTFGSPAFATGIPVVDGANLMESIKQYLVLIEQLRQGKQQIEHEIRNLKKLDISAIDNYAEQFEELYDVVGEIEGMMQDVSNIKDQFEELFPDFEGNPELSDYLKAAENIDKWLKESKKMMEGNLKIGGQVLDSLPKSQEALDEMLLASKSAEGIVQATQAGNEIAAGISQNITKLNAMMAQFIQAQTMMMQSEVSERQQTRARIKKELDSFLDYTPPPPVKSKIF